MHSSRRPAAPRGAVADMRRVLAFAVVSTLGFGLAAAQAPAAAVAAALAPAPPASEPALAGGPTTVRRLSEAQYRLAIENAFGAGLKLPGRFDPPVRAAGLLAIGDGRAVVSNSGLEQSELRAREIAAQVLAPERRKSYLDCAAAAPQSFDAGCARAFYNRYGRLLFRRPLTEAEVASTLTVARKAAALTGDYYQGLSTGLARLLMSPNFLLRVEHSEPDPAHPGQQRLDAYSLASRISFLLWDAPPDAELMDAAAGGQLRTPGGLEHQVDRLLASPRFVDGVRAFFSDMFAYEQFDGLTKDQAIFPKYTSQLAKDAREQSLRTIVDLLVTRHGDYRDLFTTKRTFLTRNLAALYRVPVSAAVFQDWVPYTFAADDPRGGILTYAGFLMLDPTHEGRSSPTIRGKSVRELFLCETVPIPPPNVNFTLVQNTSDPLHKTARERVTLHRDNPVCAGCHAITDPIGLAMENYDSIGVYRTHENGALIDASGRFDGKPYRNLLELSQILHDSPGPTRCVVQRSFEYGVGRQATASESQWLKYAVQRFAADGYAFPALLRRIATSSAFQTVLPDQRVATAN